MIEEVPSRRLAYRFTHELVRRALYDRLSGLRRAELHLRVGEALESSGELGAGARRPRAPLRGGRAVRRRSTRGVEYNVLAARAATAALAYDEAAARLRTALELGIDDPARARRAPPSTSAPRATAPASALDALAAFTAAADIARELGDAELLARAAIGYEDACWRPGITDQRCGRAAGGGGRRRSATRAPRCGWPARRPRPRARLPGGPRARGDRARERGGDGPAARRPRRPRRRAGARVLVARDDPARRRSSTCSPRPGTSARSSATPRSAPRRWPGACPRSSRCATSTRRGARSPPCARSRSRRRSRSSSTWPSTTGSAIALCDGRLDDAEARAERSHEWSRLLTGRDPSGVYGIQMFGVRREQGRLAELAPVVRMLAPATGRERPVAAGARVAARRARDGGARRGASWRGSPPTGSTVPRLAVARLAGYLADAAAALGDEAIGGPRLSRARAATPGRNVMVGHLVACYGAADRYLGMLAATLGEWERAEDALRARDEAQPRDGRA